MGAVKLTGLPATCAAICGHVYTYTTIEGLLVGPPNRNFNIRRESKPELNQNRKGFKNVELVT